MFVFLINVNYIIYFKKKVDFITLHSLCSLKNIISLKLYYTYYLCYSFSGIQSVINFFSNILLKTLQNNKMRTAILLIVLL